MVSPRQRQPRFRREAKHGLRITDRDLHILELVGQYRFLDINHVIALLGFSRDKYGRAKPIERRLSLLYHHGYLDRPRIRTYAAGSKPSIYGLTPQGSRLLVEQQRSNYPSGRTGRLHLEHTLLVSDIHIAAELSCRSHGLHLTSLEEILDDRASSEQAARDKPGGWSVSYAHTDRKKYPYPLYPDDIFAVPGERTPSLLFIEADRGTEPLERVDLRHRSSIYRKLVLYYESWKQWRDAEKTPHAPFGFRHPRVLFVISAKRASTRIRNIQKLGQKLGLAKGLFLFAVHDELVGGDFMTYEWQNAGGEPVRLLP